MENMKTLELQIKSKPFAKLGDEMHYDYKKGLSLRKYKKIFRMNSKQLSLHILGLAGIEMNGKNPWDIQVHNDRLWDRIISKRELGLAAGPGGQD